MKKLPEITIAFWIMKICATTLGETAGDLFSMTLNIGYAWSSLLLIAFFISTLRMQLYATKYKPVLYWSVILATSTAGSHLGIRICHRIINSNFTINHNIYNLEKNREISFRKRYSYFSRRNILLDSNFIF